MGISVKNEVVVMKLDKSDEPTNWSRRFKARVFRVSD